MLALGHDERVEVTGYVPELTPYFDQARVSISPLRYGAGVKGKIVSSLQAGIPVVTTGVGNEGIALADGAEVLLGETSQDLAGAVLRLLRDPALCASLSAAGADVIRQRFSENLARKVMQSVLRMDLCRVCGQVSFDARNAVPGDGPWAGQIACDKCGATNRDEALADALLAPLHGQGANSLRAAVPELSRLRIHAIGCNGPVLEQLRQTSRFTCLDDPTEAADPEGPPSRADELDLLVRQQGPEEPAAVGAFLCDLRHVLRPGGRCVLAHSGSAGSGCADAAAALRQAGFDVSVHVARGPGDDEITVVNAMKASC